MMNFKGKAVEANFRKIRSAQSAWIILVAMSVIAITQNVHALTVTELCKQSTFKLWKKQQANRLWTPTEETLSAEKTGKLFTYNCFTFEEIDDFFISYPDRIENAHFYPILEIKRKSGTEDDDDDC